MERSLPPEDQVPQSHGSLLEADAEQDADRGAMDGTSRLSKVSHNVSRRTSVLALPHNKSGLGFIHSIWRQITGLLLNLPTTWTDLLLRGLE